MRRKEIWKDVIGYEGYYQVSSIGRVKSLKRIVDHPHSGTCVKVERFLKPHLNSDGYYTVCLYKNNLFVTKKIHTLMADSFLGVNPSLVTDHINNIRTDNRIDNLQKITPRENTSKDRKNPHGILGVKKHHNKWVATIRIKGKATYLGIFDTAKEAGSAYQSKLKSLKE